MRILKYILLFILLFESGISFAQTYSNTGTANLQRASTAKGYIYRNNMGALGNVNWYTNLQIDSLINIAIGSGVTSFNSRTGVVIPLIGDYSAFYEVLSHKVQNPLDSSTTNYFSTAAVQQRLRLNPLYINPFTGHGTLADPYNLITTGAVTNGSSTVITSGGVYNAFLNYTPTSSNNLQAVTNVGNTTTLGISSLNYTLTGTAGTGYMILPTQSVLPSNPASGNHAIFTNTAGQFTILGSNGNAISFSRSVLTASRVLTAPDSSGRIALESRIIPNSNLQNSTISGVALGGNLANLTATDATLTFSGTYNGSTARTIGVNTANQFNWTNLHTFQQTLTASSGTDFGMKIIDTYNQTSTAGGTDLLINRIEGVKGSGTQRSLDIQFNSSTVFNVDRGGNTLVQGVLTTNTGITNTGTISSTGKIQANFSGSFISLLGLGTTAYAAGSNFGTLGIGLGIQPFTYTTSASINTAVSGGFHTIAIPTVSAVNAQTIPTGATLYIAGALNAGTNVTITNPRALWVAAGISQFDGSITTNGFSSTAPSSISGASAALNITDGTSSTFISAGGVKANVGTSGTHNYTSLNNNGTLTYDTGATGFISSLQAINGTIAYVGAGAFDSRYVDLTSAQSKSGVLTLNNSFISPATGQFSNGATLWFTAASGTPNAPGNIVFLNNATTNGISLNATTIGSSGVLAQTLQYKTGTVADLSDINGFITGTPTIVAGAGAGSSPTASVTTNGKQLQVTVTTGTLPTGTNATIATVTLANALSYTPLPVFSAASAATALLNGASMIYMSSTGAANITITSGTTGLTAATTYVWNVAL